MNNQIFVISGPSGVGKNTIIDELLKQVANLELGQSLTTRPPREHEVPGKYQHVSHKQFREYIDRGELLEWAEEYNNNLYGTLRPDLTKNVLLEIEVKGAAQVKALFPQSHLIFIMPPGGNIEEQLKVLRQRLQARGTDDPAVIEKRLEQDRAELDQGPQQSEKVIINDNLDQAVTETINYVKRLLAAK